MVRISRKKTWTINFVFHFFFKVLLIFLIFSHDTVFKRLGFENKKFWKKTIPDKTVKLWKISEREKKVSDDAWNVPRNGRRFEFVEKENRFQKWKDIKPDYDWLTPRLCESSHSTIPAIAFESLTFDKNQKGLIILKLSLCSAWRL